MLHWRPYLSLSFAQGLQSGLYAVSGWRQFSGNAPARTCEHRVVYVKGVWRCLCDGSLHRPERTFADVRDAMKTCEQRELEGCK